MKRINFYGVVGRDITASEFIEKLPDTGEDLEIRINSPGGDVFEGFTIYNALKNYKGNITTYIDGLAASMASIICLAGSKVIIAENAMIMIHNPSMSSYGESKDLRKNAELLDKIKAVMLDGYLKKTNIDRNALIGLLDAETWFNSKEALDNGFVDSIDTSVLEQNEKPTSQNPEKIFASYHAPVNKNKIISALGLSADSNEGLILKTIQNLKDQAKDTEPTDEDKEKASKLVRTACYDKKIKVDQIENFEILAHKNYKVVAEILDKIPKLTPGSEFISLHQNNSENRNSWTLEDYRQKDPTALKDKTLFNRLLNNK